MHTVIQVLASKNRCHYRGIMRSAIAARIRADAFASSRSRLDLGSIFGAKHQSSRTPPVERHGTPRNRPTRTGRQQQGRAPNQDKRRLGARQQRQPSRGRGTRGPRSIGLLMNNELCAGGGVGRCCCWLADEVEALDVHVALAVACSESMDWLHGS